MGSNLALQARNVLSKKFMTEHTAITDVGLFSVMTVLSCVMLVPLAFLLEGFTFSPDKMAALVSLCQA